MRLVQVWDDRGLGDGRPARGPDPRVQSCGTKGENPATEAAGTARISAADCKALAALAERQTGLRLKRRSTSKPPLSRCRLSGGGASINVYLEAGFAANQRYHNRIEETVQFNTENPPGLPQPVPDVGEKAAYNSDAGWIPALRSLLAEAAVLARAGFKLTAMG